MKNYKIKYAKVPCPQKDSSNPVILSNETIIQRKEKILKKMQERELDKIIIYCDAEHYGNFMYLVGWYSRFEESLLILKKDGSATLLLGNENVNKAKTARIENDAIHVSLFSLPNQPNRNDVSFTDLLCSAGICPKDSIGVIGWKHFTSSIEKPNMFDVPSFIIDALRQIIGEKGSITNETSLFIGEDGVRTTNNVNEIAHYEYGASLASDAVLDAMNKVDVGVTELELGDLLVRDGQRNSLTVIASTGKRFENGNLFPSSKSIKLGDPISLTTGYAGGSSSRAGYAVNNKKELPLSAKTYMEELAIPYFNAYVSWLENVKIGMKGSDIFNLIDHVLPRKEFGWSLCPGHLTAEEEWLSSPIYEGSEEQLKSGMIFQIDIIPHKPNMGGVSAESTILLADAKLKSEIQINYPEMWDRMMKRVDYIENILNIKLSEDILPMCSTVAYLRPFLLNKEYALIKQGE